MLLHKEKKSTVCLLCSKIGAGTILATLPQAPTNPGLVDFMLDDIEKDFACSSNMAKISLSFESHGMVADHLFTYLL
jgi:hypothetical protein